MSGTERLFRRFLSLVGSKILATLIAFVSTPIIVRLLGPGGYGDYAVLLSIFSLYMIPISSAVTEGVQKFVAENRQVPNWREQVIRFYLLTAFVLVAIGVLVLFVFTRLGFAERTFGDRFTLYFYLLVGFVFVSQFRAISVHTVLGLGLEHISGPLTVLKKFVTVALGVALVVGGHGVAGMLTAHIAANALIVVIATGVVARRISPRSVLTRADSLPSRELLSFNILNVVLVLLVMSLFHIDIVMLQMIKGSETTGYYKAALALAEYLWIVPIVLQTLLLHSSSSLWSDGKHERITEVAGRITRYTTLLVLLLAVGLGTLADRFVPLYYGEAFSVATTPLLLLLPGAIGFAVARPLQGICQGSGRLRVLILATGIAATLNLVLNATLIPVYGMNGAAVATSVGYGSMFLLLVWSARQIGYDPLVDFRPGRIVATIATSGALIVSTNSVIENDLIAFAMVPTVGLVFFTIAAVLTRALDPEEITEILHQLPLPFGMVDRLRGG